MFIVARARLVAVCTRNSVMLCWALVARSLDIWRLCSVVSAFGVYTLAVDAVYWHVRTGAWSL